MRCVPLHFTDVQQDVCRMQELDVLVGTSSRHPPWAKFAYSGSSGRRLGFVHEVQRL